MNRPLQIASPTHPAALSCYFIQAVLGFGFIADLSAQGAITALVGVTFAGTWAVLFLLGGIIALIAAMANPKMRNPSPALKAEAVAAFTLFGCIGLYHASLIVSFGPGGVITTQLLCIAFELGGLGRFVQIVRERRRIRKSLAHPHATNPAPLAEA